MLRKIVLSAIALQVFTLAVIAQTTTKVSELQKASASLGIKSTENFQLALKLAKEKGWMTSFKTGDGNLAFLMGVDPFGAPIYYTTNSNVTAANTIGANHLWDGGSSGLNLSGSSMNVRDKMAVWDGGRVLSSHQEFNNRVSQMDGAVALSDHATHVAGTMIASGVSASSKGIAFGSLGILAYDFSSDAAEMFGVASNLLVSNHSYGTITGWNFNQSSNRWEFYGQPGDNEDRNFGYYNTSAQLWDSIAFNAPYYLIVQAAGNSRNSNGPSIGGAYFRRDASGTWVPESRGEGMSSNDGYGIIATTANAKNTMTVGAIQGMVNGYSNPQSVLMSNFSCWGPTDDGRIKPDVVSMGVNLVSPISSSATGYGNYSGTSMAAPNVTAGLLLLQEYYSRLNQGGFMRAATLKGLAIHTTDEAGLADGPDYIYGWGVLNVKKATDVIKAQDTGSHKIIESVLQNGATYSTTVKATGPLTVTISWTDPKGTVLTSNILNNPDRKLVNDLDVRVVSASGAFLPWILDPANPANAATKGDNVLDNVERINILNPPVGEPLTITVSHKGNLQRGTQAFSLIISGIAAKDHDLTVAEVVSPQQNSCENPSHFVTVKVKNNGSQTKTNIPVSLVVKNGTNVISTQSAVYKGTLTTGSTGNFTFQSPVNLQAGTVYSFEAAVAEPSDEDKNNDTLKVNVAIATNPGAPTAGGVICGTNALLKITAPITGANYFWYADATSTTPLATGSAANISSVPPNNTFFVGRGGRGTAGLANKTAFGGSYISSTDLTTSHYMHYSSTVPLVLETARLYSKKGGKINFIVASINGSTINVVSTTTVDVQTTAPVPAGGNQPNDAADDGAVYHLNLNLPAGDYVIIAQTEGDANIFRNDNVSGNPYPFSIPGLISFTGNSAGANFQNFYFFLYDMKIRTQGCISTRNSFVAGIAPVPVVTQVADEVVSNIQNGNQWLLNNTIITGATNNKYKPTASGMYSVIVSDSYGCQMSSNSFNFVVSSLNNLPPGEIGLTVSPNPSNGNFVLRFRVEKKEDVKIEMMNTQGQNVYAKTYSRFQGIFTEQINLKNLASGIYVLRVRQGNKVYHQKLIIN